MPTDIPGGFDSNILLLLLSTFVLQDGCTLLYVAAQEGKTEVAHVLLQAGADVDRPAEVRCLPVFCCNVMPVLTAFGPHMQTCNVIVT